MCTNTTKEFPQDILECKYTSSVSAVIKSVT